MVAAYNLLPQKGLAAEKTSAEHLSPDRGTHGNGCPDRDLRLSHGVVTCITASELEMSIIRDERAARRHCPPEPCSGEKKLLHWPRCSVAPHQPIREFHLEGRGMALKVPNRLPVVHRQQNGSACPCCCRQQCRPLTALMVVKGVTFLEEVFYG